MGGMWQLTKVVAGTMQDSTAAASELVDGKDRDWLPEGKRLATLSSSLEPLFPKMSFLICKSGFINDHTISSFIVFICSPLHIQSLQLTISFQYSNRARRLLPLPNHPKIHPPHPLS